MKHHRHHRSTGHHCELQQRKYRRFARGGFNTFYRRAIKWFVDLHNLWEDHYRVGLYFRSRLSVENERKRHLNHRFKYIIHPFSKLNYVRTMANTLIWLVFFFHDLWIAGFDAGTMIYYENIAVGYVIVNSYLFFDCILNFYTGHVDFKTHEVVLDHGVIIERYLKSFFICDFFASIPYLTVCYSFNFRNVYLVSTCEWLHLLRCFRIKSCVRRVKDLLRFCDIGQTCYYVMITFFIVVFQINLFVCLSNFVARRLCVLYGCEQTWLDHYYKTEDDETGEATDEEGPPQPQQEVTPANTRLGMYIDMLEATVTNYFRIGSRNEYYTNELEYMMLIATWVCGYVTDTCIIAFYMRRVSASNVSDSVYQRLIAQTRPFVRTHGLLDFQLDVDINAYYEAVYRGRYFDHDEIYRTLSTALRHDLMIHDCRHSFENIQLFADLPKDVVEQILMKTKKEHYLANDVVLIHTQSSRNRGDETLYLIAYGTIAVYHSTGVELTHYRDGDIVGDLSLLDERASSSTSLSASMIVYLAIETCEVMSIEVNEIREICDVCPLFKERLLQGAQTKMRRLQLRIGVLKKTQKEMIEEFAKCMEVKQLRDNYYDLH